MGPRTGLHILKTRKYLAPVTKQMTIPSPSMTKSEII